MGGPRQDGDAADPRVERVLARFAREGRRPIALYRELARAPHLLEPYSALAQALRHDAVTPRPLRELVILRIAHLTGSAYEWSHHRAMAEREGVPAAKIRAAAGAEDAGALDEDERLALRLADETHAMRVSPATTGELARRLGEAGAVELVMLASLYEAVARLIDGLGVEVEDEYRPYEGLP